MTGIPVGWVEPRASPTSILKCEELNRQDAKFAKEEERGRGELNHRDAKFAKKFRRE
jgi:hypothetical protein